MIPKKFTIHSEVWVYPVRQLADAGWHFVTLDKTLSAQIRETYKTGFVKVEAMVGKATWNTSLFPHKQSKAYLLCIKNQIRKKEGILAGDKNIVSIKIL
ncbi:MAG: DUF1905 domain-containing protein [Patescibacteria group bacterium]